MWFIALVWIAAAAVIAAAFYVHANNPPDVCHIDPATVEKATPTSSFDDVNPNELERGLLNVGPKPQNPFDEIDPTPTKQDGTPSYEFEPSDIRRAEKAKEQRPAGSKSGEPIR
jgi:hypothetical protein